MIRLTVPDFDEEEFQAVREVLKSGYLVQDEKVAKFESMVADYVGTKYAVAVSSGTAALHLSLLALGIGPGDEVIVPDFTFPATANVVELCGARPILIDVDIETYNIDPVKIERFIDQNCDYDETMGLVNKQTRGTVKVIMPVHLFGQPADMDPIKQIAQKYNLKIVEDAACALGAEYEGKKCGNLSHIGCFSFHPRKILTTGEGGMITTNDASIANKVQLLRNHGMDKGSGKIDFVLPGFNYRMSEVEATIGIVQMRHIEDTISKRVSMAQAYNQFMKNLEWLSLPKVMSGAKHIFQSYVIIVKDVIDRDTLIKKLGSKGIESTIGTHALHCMSYYRGKYSYPQVEFPNALHTFKSGLSLPLHSKLTDSDIRFIADYLNTI